jgi:hypothetical protein
MAAGPAGWCVRMGFNHPALAAASASPPYRRKFSCLLLMSPCNNNKWSSGDGVMDLWRRRCKTCDSRR